MSCSELTNSPSQVVVVMPNGNFPGPILFGNTVQPLCNTLLRLHQLGVKNIPVVTPYFKAAETELACFGSHVKSHPVLFAEKEKTFDQIVSSFRHKFEILPTTSLEDVLEEMKVHSNLAFFVPYSDSYIEASGWYHDNEGPGNRPGAYVRETNFNDPVEMEIINECLTLKPGVVAPEVSADPDYTHTMQLALRCGNPTIDIGWVPSKYPFKFVNRTGLPNKDAALLKPEEEAKKLPLQLFAHGVKQELEFLISQNSDSKLHVCITTDTPGYGDSFVQYFTSHEFFADNNKIHFSFIAPPKEGGFWQDLIGYRKINTSVMGTISAFATLSAAMAVPYQLKRLYRPMAINAPKNIPICSKPKFQEGPLVPNLTQMFQIHLEKDR